MPRSAWRDTSEANASAARAPSTVINTRDKPNLSSCRPSLLHGRSQDWGQAGGFRGIIADVGRKCRARQVGAWRSGTGAEGAASDGGVMRSHAAAGERVSGPVTLAVSAA